MVLQRESAAVRFGDLPAENEPDTRTCGLRREERHEEIGIVRQPRAFVVDPELQGATIAPPTDRDAAAGFERGVDGVVQQVDEELLELIRIGANRDFFGSGPD